MALKHLAFSMVKGGPTFLVRIPRSVLILSSLALVFRRGPTLCTLVIADLQMGEPDQLFGVITMG